MQLDSGTKIRNFANFSYSIVIVYCSVQSLSIIYDLNQSSQYDSEVVNNDRWTLIRLNTVANLINILRS